MMTANKTSKHRCGICGKIGMHYFAFGSEKICGKCYTPIKNVIIGYIQMLRYKFEVNEHRKELRDKQ